MKNKLLIGTGREPVLYLNISIQRTEQVLIELDISAIEEYVIILLLLLLY